MPTIFDIADELNISASTVSRALRDEKVVNKQTMSLVKEAAERLHYVPNRNAQILRRKESRQIGVIIPDISNPIYGLFAKGIDDALKARGYHMALSCASRSPQEEADLVELFYQNRCGGIIMCTSESAACEQRSDNLRYFADEGSPIVLSGYQSSGDIVADYIGLDDAAGASMVADYLCECGHRKIAFAGGQDCRPYYSRLAGYMQSLAASGVKYDPELVLEGGFVYESGVELAPKVADLIRTGRITAVMCMNDIVAIGLMDTLLAMGISVPDDVSVAGFDNILQSQWTSVPLTTVSQSQYEIGRLCAERIVSRIEGDKSPAVRILMDLELVIRKSVKTVNA